MSWLTVQVKRSAGTNRHGIPLPPTEFELSGCAFAPAGSTEDSVDAATVEWDVDLLIRDPDADLQAKDVVIVGEERFDVFGRPARYRSPYTGFGGLVARLKGVQG